MKLTGGSNARQGLDGRVQGHGSLYLSILPNAFARQVVGRSMQQRATTSRINRRGYCHDNAVVESFLQLLKQEQLKRRFYRIRDKAEQDVIDHIELF